MNKQIKDIEKHLAQSEIKMFLDTLSLKYKLPADELAKVILVGDLAMSDLEDFLKAEFNLADKGAGNFIDEFVNNIIASFYTDKEEVFLQSNIAEVKDKDNNLVDWRKLIQPKKLQADLDDFNKIISGDVARVRNYLWKSLGLEKANEVVIVLTWLAQSGELLDIWQNDSRFKGILKKYISSKFSEALANEAMLGEDNKDVIMFAGLRMILQDKLKIDENNSAMLAIVIIDYLSDEEKRKYILTAYLSEQDNKFYWNNIKVSGEKLVLNN